MYCMLRGANFIIEVGTDILLYTSMYVISYIDICMYVCTYKVDMYVRMHIKYNFIFM